MNMPSLHRLLLSLLLGLHVALAFCGQAAGAAVPSQEYKLKAAFLVNFIRFITWPEAAFTADTNELRLCILGENPFGEDLQRAQVTEFNGRRLQVQTAGSEQELADCQMIYLNQAVASNAGETLKNLKDQPVVTVSDHQGFVELGGSIEFVTRDGRLAFIINQTGLRKLGITVSSAMLDLAANLR
jgi:hypothetical protein